MKYVLSKIFDKTLGKIITKLREQSLQKYIRAQSDGTYKVNPVPRYISQLSGSKTELVKGFYGEILDFSAANRFGSESLEDFSFWSWRACGIVCVEMTLKAIIGAGFKKTTRELISEGLDFNGYNIASDIGWFHSSLIQLLHKYGVRAYSEKFIPPARIAKYILDNRYVISSLLSKSGGHLVLIYGVTIEKGNIISFTIHDPYDFSQTGQSLVYPIKQFNKLSKRRAIIVEGKV